MRLRQRLGISTFLLLYIASTASAGDVLSSSGFTSCLTNGTVNVSKANVQFDRSTGVVTFDVAGSSSKEQDVLASLVVTAYGKQVYQKDFNPCDAATKVDQLCPGEFLCRCY